MTFMLCYSSYSSIQQKDGNPEVITIDFNIVLNVLFLNGPSVFENR